MNLAVTIVAVIAAALLSTCSSANELSVRSLSDDRPLAFEQLEMRGVRDGDRMDVSADLRGESGRIELKLKLAIGVPTRLISGRFEAEIEGQSLEGSVTARSVTFLGGQSDWPNLGGDFILRNHQDSYRVRVPVTQVEP